MSMIYDYYQPHIHKPGDPIAPAKTRWIWNVFWILLVVTTAEVSIAFGNYYNHWGIDQILKIIYILLTLLKAYYIIFSYMHLGHEKRSFKITLGFLAIILTYFIILMMNEGYYQDIIHYNYPAFMKGVGTDGAVHH